MKKYLVLLQAAIMILSLAACAGTDVGTVSFLDVPFGGTVTVELEEGGIAYIHGTAAGSDWVSCYLQVAVNKVG